MKALFLSDAHLWSPEDQGYQYLLRFLDSEKETISHLFIAGDFFDFWFCDSKHIFPGFVQMIDKLLELKKSGVAIYLFEGNHDFFLERFFGRYGITVFPDEGLIDLDGKRLFVAHGDLVDTSNTMYLFLRKFLRSTFFYTFKKLVPYRILWAIARISSKTSKGHMAKPTQRLANRMNTFARKKLREGFDAVIMGHCHRPMVREYTIDNEIKSCVLLGDWISYYSYLVYHNGRFRLLYYNGES